MIVTVANEKGGVGKTTLVLHMAFAAVEAGRRTLVVDFDTQGNASQHLSENPVEIATTPGGAETLLDGTPSIRQSVIEGIDFLHGHRGLEAVDTSQIANASELREKILSLGYDVVIVDTPPSFGARHVAPLFWADRIVVPLEPTLSSLAGLSGVQQTMKAVRQRRPAVKTFYVINRAVRQSSSHRTNCDQLQEILGKQLLDVLTLRVAVTDALAAHKPVWRFPGDAKLKRQWQKLCSTILDLE